MTGSIGTWCDHDEHKLYEHFIDFNNWLDSGEEDALRVLAENYLENFSQPSKAFYAGDKEAYEQVFKAYRIQRRHEVLSKQFLNTTLSDDHWYERNEERFNQLVVRLSENSVVPFIGAGISVAGGFPTWKDHLRQQGGTAGINNIEVEEHLAKGEFEAVIESIEQAPETESELVDRNIELARLGITAIWYPKGRYELVEEILCHARNEVKYKMAGK